MVEEPIDRIRKIEQILNDKYAVPNLMVVELEAIVDKNARQEERMVSDSLAQALEGVIKPIEPDGTYCSYCDTTLYDIGQHNADEAREALKAYKARITWG